jgi:hypothetical protein
VLVIVITLSLFDASAIDGCAHTNHVLAHACAIDCTHYTLTCAARSIVGPNTAARTHVNTSITQHHDKTCKIGSRHFVFRKVCRAITQEFKHNLVATQTSRRAHSHTQISSLTCNVLRCSAVHHVNVHTHTHTCIHTAMKRRTNRHSYYQRLQIHHLLARALVLCARASNTQSHTNNERQQHT